MMTDDDLRRALHRAAAHIDGARPPGAAEAIRRGRSRVAYRRVGSAGAGLLVAAVLAVSLGALQQAFLGRTPETAARSAPDPTSREAYELSGFTIDFPWPEGSNQSSTALAAGVRFEATWSTSAFPGRAECQLTLLGADGAPVGTAAFFASYLSRTAHPPPVVVDVTSPPEAARGTCGPGTYPQGAGYVIREITVDESDDPGWTAVEFKAVWASEADPTWRECRLEARLLSGTTLSQTFTLSVPDGALVNREIHAPPAAIGEVSVTCREVS